LGKGGGPRCEGSSRAAHVCGKGEASETGLAHKQKKINEKPKTEKVGWGGGKANANNWASRSRGKLPAIRGMRASMPGVKKGQKEKEGKNRDRPGRTKKNPPT